MVQRVTRAWVSVAGPVGGDGERVAEIGPGLLALVGVAPGDTASDAAELARKIHGLRILRDATSVADDPTAQVLVVSQFTLYADTRRGRRPSWSGAAPAAQAEPLVQAVVDGLRERGALVQTGVFGADMRVGLINDGPVTLVLDVPAT